MKSTAFCVFAIMYNTLNYVVDEVVMILTKPTAGLYIKFIYQAMCFVISYARVTREIMFTVLITVGQYVLEWAGWM